MASITASPTGGLWSSTAAWVGGVVPISTDAVFIDGTSGPITVDSPVTCATLVVSAGTFQVGANTINLIGTSGTVFSVGGAVVFSGDQASIVIASASASTRTFTASAKRIGAITYTATGSTGALQFFSSANSLTVGTLNVGPGHTVVVFAGGRITVDATWNVTGASGNNAVIHSSTGGSPATVIKPDGAQVLDPFLTSTDISYLAAMNGKMLCCI